LLRNPAHIDVAPSRQLLDLGQARILRPGLDQHLAHVFGVVLDRCGNGVDADDPLVLFGHARGFGIRDWGSGKAVQAGDSTDSNPNLESLNALQQPQAGHPNPSAQYFFLARFAGLPRGGKGLTSRSRSPARRKSILRSSRLALSTMMLTRSPRRNSRPTRSPVRVLRTGSKW